MAPHHRSRRRSNHAPLHASFSFSFSLAFLLLVVTLYRFALHRFALHPSPPARTSTHTATHDCENITSCKQSNHFSQPSLLLQAGALSRQHRGMPVKQCSHTTATRTQTLLILLIAGDIQQNPGPVQHPCGWCERAVAENHRAVECDGCESWFHIKCSGMTLEVYKRLSGSFEWTCPSCGLPGFTDSFFNSITDIADPNPFSNLDTSVDTEYADSNLSMRLDLIPVDASTPQRKNPRSKNKPLKCISLNCNSLKSTGKVAELQNIIDNIHPDIIFACETKLNQSHATYSIFPKNYTVLRKDRDQNGGGVLIAVKDDIVFSEPTFLADIDGEAKWVCLEFANSKPMYLCSYYIPETSDGSACLEQMKEALCRIYTKHKCSPPLIHIAGDLNLGDIDWDTMKPTCARSASHHNKLIDLLDEFGMQNMQTEPSRPASGKCLDLVITNMPVSVSNIATAPGMSDHDLVTFELNAKPKRIAKPPHKIYQYAKSNVDQLKDELTKITTEFFKNNPASKSVNANWTYFRTKVLAAIDKHIPNKTTSAKHNLPWITRTIK